MIEKILSTEKDNFSRPFLILMIVRGVIALGLTLAVIIMAVIIITQM